MSRIQRALAAGLLALTSTVLAPATGADAAGQPGYVAIVISGEGTSCVRWFAGITGDDVLNTVASVHYRRDGLIDQIGGRPSTPGADASHYWSYWHDTAGSWQYSASGASGSTPVAGSVEGWSYVDGSASHYPPPQNPAGLYAALCGSSDGGTSPTTPSKPRTTSVPSASAGTERNGGVRSTAPPGGGNPGGRRSATASVVPTNRSAGRLSGARTSATSGSRSADRASVAVPSVAGASGSQIVDASQVAGVAKPKASGGSALLVVFGLALVVLLGAGAGWTVLRRRRTDAAGL